MHTLLLICACVHVVTGVSYLGHTKRNKAHSEITFIFMHSDCHQNTVRTKTVSSGACDPLQALLAGPPRVPLCWLAPGLSPWNSFFNLPFFFFFKPSCPS